MDVKVGRVERIAQILKNVPLLQKFTDAERAKLASLLVDKKYLPGEIIVTQGEESNGFFIVQKGELVVTKRNKPSDPSVEIGRLYASDYFGEAGLLSNAPRGATVKVAPGQMPAECFYLDRDNFFSVFSKQRLNVQFAKRNAVSAERGGTQTAPKVPKDAVRTKTPAQHALILGAIQDNVLFMGMDAAHKDGVVREMYRWTFKKGENAVVQGDMGDNLYVIESGEFDVFVHGKKVATRGKGTLFGELALLYNAPRAATVTASADAVVWVVDRFTFRRVVTDLSEKKYQTYVSFLQKVPLLQPLAEYERGKVAEALEEVHIRAGQTVFRQGAAGDCMYIVFEGELSVSKTADSSSSSASSSSSGAVQVNVIKAGGYFGERALLNKEPRAATVTAISDVKLLKLDRNAFALLLGPLEDIMKAKISEDDDVEHAFRKGGSAAASAVAAHASSSSSSTSSSSSSSSSSASSTFAVPGTTVLGVRPQDVVDPNAPQDITSPIGTVAPGFHGVKFQDLKVLGTLGKGSFGYVQLVQDAVSKKTFALKAVSKTQIVQTGQQGHIMSEKRAMMIMNHPFLVRLYQTFRDQHRLFFLLDVVLGGELFTLLRSRSLFDEDTARFFSASVILAFEYMHDRNYVYRDLKPENLLIDSDGYVKVTDFGFAKYIASGRTWTLCGTPDYLAPEIVAGAGHGKGVDWWTIGIFIFEMLASYPPFYDEDPMRTYAKIMDGVIQFPSHFSKEAISLIKKFLNHKPTKRLGVVKGGAKLIKIHPWYQDFDWNALIERRLRPSYVPDIKGNADLSHFETLPEGVGAFEQYQDDGSAWDKDF